MYKRLIVAGLVSYLLFTGAPPLTQEPSKIRKLNSSIDSKIDKLFNETQFKSADIPKCPNPYVQTKYEKLEMSSSLKRYVSEVCETDRYVLTTIKLLDLKDNIYQVTIRKLSPPGFPYVRKEFRTEKNTDAFNGDYVLKLFDSRMML